MKTLKKILILSTFCLMSFSASSNEVTTTENINFPEINKSYLKEVHQYQLSDIQQLKSGLNKDQVRHILGNPHFSEGIFFVKKWNYVLDINQENTHLTQPCELLLDFDKTSHVEGIHWKDATCEALFLKNLQRTANTDTNT